MHTTTLSRTGVDPSSRLDRRFRAMGSDVHVVVVGGSVDMLDRAVARIEQLESRWSRFRPESEVTMLNNSTGHPVAASSDTRLLVSRAIEAWRLTGGSFDPTLLDDLRRAGYDRSFENLGDDPDRQAVAPRSRSIDAPGCTDIIVDATTVTIPVGLGFDPGGIGKGLAADLVATELIAEGVSGVCINIGGDLRVLGESPSGNGWTLAIDHPQSTVPIALVGLAEGAIATSSVLRRTWKLGDQMYHHLIDPATGAPSESDLAFASIITGEGWRAEVLAKAALLRGRARAFDLIDAATAGVVVDHSGLIDASDGFSTFLGGVALPVILELDLHGEPQ
ncbi:MAG: FAD:protein FMN transferase [Ilumatobacteraceae bacterium]|nr:FAD:protein FMN transferase [Ilumatobacteraceae bacterium]